VLAHALTYLPPLAVGMAGPMGPTVARAQAAERARYERRLLTKLSAMELPSPPSSGITIQAHR
jgi:hypothetical protein